MSTATGSLAERVRAADTRALARAISLVEDDDPRGRDVVRELYPHTGSASLTGITGPPGAGKSTLIGAMVSRLRARRRTVGVLSVDPSSPFAGGAVLGDRIRMSEHFGDPGVYIRSMATRGALGGLAEAALQATLLIDAAGYDEIILETVGVGQAEVDIVSHADSVVLVLIPGAGDSVQALKAGVMEIPDVIVINKADHPMASTLARQIRGTLLLAPDKGRNVSIVRTEAVRGRGVDELLDALARHRARIAGNGLLEERRRQGLVNEVIALAAARARARLATHLHDQPELLAEVLDRRLDPASAARRIVRFPDNAALDSEESP
jgi:LAO/AO transport system kinase